MFQYIVNIKGLSCNPATDNHPNSSHQADPDAEYQTEGGYESDNEFDDGNISDSAMRDAGDDSEDNPRVSTAKDLLVKVGGHKISLSFLEGFSVYSSEHDFEEDKN